MIVAFGGPNANGWDQLLYLGAALVLSAAIGFERELRGLHELVVSTGREASVPLREARD